MLPAGTFPRSWSGAAHVATCVVSLETDAGLQGLGFCVSDACAQIERLALGLLAGKDPRGVVGHWQRMMDRAAGHDDGGAAYAAIAALDLALWDLKAKSNDEPLWKTFGGLRPRVNVHAGACDPSANGGVFADWYGGMARDFGFRGAVVHAGPDSHADARRLEVVRETLLEHTAEPALMIDLGERFTPKDAARRVRELEQTYDLAFVQDPARRHDSAGLKRVSNSIRAAVCSGGRLAIPAHYLAHFHAHALDVVQLGVWSGGVTAALQIADTAYGFELPVVLTDSPGNLHAHLAAAMPYCMSMEVCDPFAAGSVLESDVRIEDGRAIAGDRPGHGLSIDPQAFAHARATSKRAAVSDQ